MKMLSIMRTESFVRFTHEVKGPTIKANDPKNPGTVTETSGIEEHKVTAHEIPLASFDKALQALAEVAVNILELGEPYKKGITVRKLAISYTKTGTRSAAITFDKALDATGTLHQMSTPFFRIDDADDGRRQCAKGHAARVVTMINEAEGYAVGERQQGILNFKEPEEAEPADGDELPLGAEAGAKRKPGQSK